jgi:hypothetical protein
MATRVYVIPISNPAAAGAAMLRHKRIPHRVVSLMPGLHPLLLRLAGFERPPDWVGPIPRGLPASLPRGRGGSGELS